jgi:hypothetical protein
MIWVINVNEGVYLGVEAETVVEARHGAYRIFPEWMGAWITTCRGEAPTQEEIKGLQLFMPEGD